MMHALQNLPSLLQNVYPMFNFYFAILATSIGFPKNLAPHVSTFPIPRPHPCFAPNWNLQMHIWNVKRK